MATGPIWHRKPCRSAGFVAVISSRHSGEHSSPLRVFVNVQCRGASGQHRSRLKSPLQGMVQYVVPSGKSSFSDKKLYTARSRMFITAPGGHMMVRYHDTGYKELFSHPEFVTAMLDGFLPHEISRLPATAHSKAIPATTSRHCSKNASRMRSSHWRSGRILPPITITRNGCTFISCWGWCLMWKMH